MKSAPLAIGQGTDFATTVSLQADGTIIAAGVSQGEFAVVRLLP